MTSTKMCEPTPIMMSTTKKQTLTFPIFEKIWTTRLPGSLESLHSSLAKSAGKLWLSTVQQKSGVCRTERVKVSLHWNLRQKFVGRLFKRNKTSNEGILRLKSHQWELSDDLLHMPIACVLIELPPFNSYVTHEWFWWPPILFTQILGYVHGFFEIFLRKWR